MLLPLHEIFFFDSTSAITPVCIHFLTRTSLAISVIVEFVNNQNCKFVYFLLEAVFFVNSWFKLVIIVLYVNRPTLNKIIILYIYIILYYIILYYIILYYIILYYIILYYIILYIIYYILYMEQKILCHCSCR